MVEIQAQVVEVLVEQELQHNLIHNQEEQVVTVLLHQLQVRL